MIILLIRRYTISICDPGWTQTSDLQNRNLTFYSLNYGAIEVAKIVINIYLQSFF